MHIQTLHIGEEDGAPVHVALVRCRLYRREFLAPERASNPRGTLLWWDKLEHGAAVRTVALPLNIECPEMEEVYPDMGAVANEVTWHTGHLSSSATVCDIYFDDGSVLLTVITPAHQQALNMVQVGTAAYTAPEAA